MIWGRRVTRQSITKQKRARIFRRDGGVCIYCNSMMDLTIHHLKPLSRGGSNHPSNLVTACRTCNQSLGNRDCTVIWEDE